MANEGAAPPNFNTLAGQVRLLVGDTDASNITAGVGTYAWYSDAELEALGEQFGNNPKKVAIWVLSQVAITPALKLKKWTSEDLQVDGPAITRSIENTLKRLAKEVADEVTAGGDEEEFVFTPFEFGHGVYPTHGNWWVFN